MALEHKIRIPMIDEMLKKHNTDHVNIVSVTNTPDEKEKLKKLDNDLEKEIDLINNVINEVLEYLEARGCEVSKYI